MKVRWSDIYILDGPGKWSDYEVLMLHLDLRVVRLSSINIPVRSLIANFGIGLKNGQIVMCWSRQVTW
jgi:hypothetical protein